MKKYISFLLCLIMLLSLVSCDNTETNDTITSDTEDTNIEIDTTQETTAESSDNETESNNKQETSSEITDSDDPSIPEEPPLSAPEPVRQAFDAVLKNEATLIYKIYNYPNTERYLQEIFNLTLSDAPLQALVDMDEDGIYEIVLTKASTYDNDKILLRYYNGAVYGYSFGQSQMSQVYADGSFSWTNSDNDIGISESGISRLSFDGTELKFKELLRTEHISRFYIEGVEVTQDEYNDHLASRPQASANYTLFDMSSWNVSKALEMASEYWGIAHGSFDEETGFRYRMHVYKDGTQYRVCLYWLKNNYWYEHLKCVLVDITTGEVSIPEYPDAKG